MSERELSILVNGQPRSIPAETTLSGLLARLGIERRVAVAVNRRVVPRSLFASHRIASGDRIEILEAVGGG